MRLVHVKPTGLTTIWGENAVSPAEPLRTNNDIGPKMRLVLQKFSGLTTILGENAVSPGKILRTNNDMGRKCS